MRVLHRVQCARRNGNRAAGDPVHRVDTRPFVSQAHAMSRMRGDPDYGLAIVEHPIGTLTDAELSERAATAAPQVIACLVDR